MWRWGAGEGTRALASQNWHMPLTFLTHQLTKQIPWCYAACEHRVSIWHTYMDINRSASWGSPHLPASLEPERAVELLQEEHAALSVHAPGLRYLKHGRGMFQVSACRRVWLIDTRSQQENHLHSGTTTDLCRHAGTEPACQFKRLQIRAVAIYKDYLLKNNPQKKAVTIWTQGFHCVAALR